MDRRGRGSKLGLGVLAPPGVRDRRSRRADSIYQVCDKGPSRNVPHVTGSRVVRKQRGDDGD